MFARFCNIENALNVGARIPRGLAIMQQDTKNDISWVSDIFVKLLCGVSTVLLGVAVSSLQSMNTEIKQLSANVFELSSQSKVINVTVIAQEKRLDKMEAEIEVIKKFQHPK